MKIWNVGSWDCVLTMPGHDDFVRTVKGLSGDKIASGSYNFNFNYLKL